MKKTKRKQIIKILILVLILSLFSIHMKGQTKKALIIVNDDYIEFADLHLSIEDHFKLRIILTKMGYEVTLIKNTNHSEMLRALDAFFKKSNTMSLLYYSGHAYKSKNDNNVYLTPIDAEIENGIVKESGLISIKQISYLSSKSNSEQNVLMFNVTIDVELGEIQKDIKKDIQRTKFSKIDENNTIILSNINQKNTSKRTSYLLKIFLHELENTSLTIRDTFENVRDNSRKSQFLDISVFLGGFDPTLTWGRGNVDISIILPGGESRMLSFPFPPPKASASYIIDKKNFKDAKNLFRVNEILSKVLEECGYREKSYYQIPNGFALVTRIEKIDLDVYPYPEPERWTITNESSRNDFSIKNYLRSLFYAKQGKYRVIVFFITNITFGQTEKSMTFTEAKKHLKRGHNSLPIEFQSVTFDENYSCTALIYEFDKFEFEEGVQVDYSQFLGHDHLIRNNFLPVLLKSN